MLQPSTTTMSDLLLSLLSSEPSFPLTATSLSRAWLSLSARTPSNARRTVTICPRSQFSQRSQIGTRALWTFQVDLTRAIDITKWSAGISGACSSTPHAFSPQESVCRVSRALAGRKRQRDATSPQAVLSATPRRSEALTGTCESSSPLAAPPQ